MTLHCTNEEICRHVDGTLPAEERAVVEAHLRECAQCAALAAQTMRLGDALRKLPLERTSAGFTASVLRELGMTRQERRGLRMLEGAAALVAMVVVVGVLLSVFFLTGVLTQSHVSATQSAAGEVLRQGGSLVGDLVGTARTWLAGHLPFAAGGGALGISAAAAVVLALLALFDRVAGGRWIGRAN